MEDGMKYGPNGMAIHEGWERIRDEYYWFPNPTQSSAHYAIMLREIPPAVWTAKARGAWYYNTWTDPDGSTSANGPNGYIPDGVVKNLEEAKAWVIAVYRMR
jgi:hypothetical protein